MKHYRLSNKSYIIIIRCFIYQLTRDEGLTFLLVYFTLSMKTPFTLYSPPIRRTIFCLLIASFSFSACASMDKMYLATRKKLWDSIRVFNNNFESKSRSACTTLVISSLRGDCLVNMGEFKKRVTISDVSLVGAIFFRKGIPVKQAFPNPEEAFDEAEITHQYQVVVQPSNRVKSITVKQKWILDDGDWYVIPNFSPFYQ